ncbi:STAS-like domain-containing protein [Candidatus Nitronereus thalassa]|uniref:STAS-like domain-containing protein n=1 Tax=Candidatus Nitronereus thalassa TaxID=3020898 RepID=A0ABU3KA40_9BACT|nr:STAS-like domain-containing protein [Candidatus Nitronereus thalassa]MDT7043310.1 STAS-like domain-containing protein [Candidatus Nitronereus thalassa]
MIINVKEITGPYCGQYDEGELLYNVVCPLLLEKQSIVLDFSGVALLSSSFLNAAISKLFHKFGADFLISHLFITGMKKVDRFVLNRMIKEAKEIRDYQPI